MRELHRGFTQDGWWRATLVLDDEITEELQVGQHVSVASGSENGARFPWRYGYRSSRRRARQARPTNVRA